MSLERDDLELTGEDLQEEKPVEDENHWLQGAQLRNKRLHFLVIAIVQRSN